MLIPPKLLAITTTDIQTQAAWTVQNPNDPWVGYPYRWQVTFNVSPQSHSSAETTTPFYFNGNDVNVGDWFADLSAGLSVQIISIMSQNPSSVTAVVEDIDRYNTFTDPTGNGTGIGATGRGFLFTLGDDGLPVLTPMSILATALQQNLAWQLDQISRFRYRNLLHSFYRISQPGHGLNPGDVIYLQSNGAYALVNPNTSTVVAAVGTVSSVGVPGPNYFAFRPVGRVVRDLVPALPGQPGSLIYLAANGTLSTSPPGAWARPLYIQLGDSTTAIALDRSVQTPADAQGYVNKISVVANTASVAGIAAPNHGDQVLVEDAGTGEWSHMIRHNDDTWRLMVTQDASHVDAETLDASVSGAASQVVTLGNVSQGRSITSATINVTSPFGASDTLTIGTSENPTLLLPENQADIATIGTYTVTPNFVTTAATTELVAVLTVQSANGGAATVLVTYT